MLYPKIGNEPTILSSKHRTIGIVAEDECVTPCRKIPLEREPSLASTYRSYSRTVKIKPKEVVVLFAVYPVLKVNLSCTWKGVRPSKLRTGTMTYGNSSNLASRISMATVPRKRLGTKLLCDTHELSSSPTAHRL
ncbi:hypothetical protein [Paenibacillus amylolyticus]|uniref:hypothetical protein n=1 Tax=Paenibacillus amylolyticus TaxID=1451 RepID=UPI003EBE156B